MVTKERLGTGTRRTLVGCDEKGVGGDANVRAWVSITTCFALLIICLLALDV